LVKATPFKSTTAKEAGFDEQNMVAEPQWIASRHGGKYFPEFAWPTADLQWLIICNFFLFLFISLKYNNITILPINQCIPDGHNSIGIKSLYLCIVLVYSDGCYTH
jgi:hypothetical protein